MSVVGCVMERSVIIQTLGVDLCSGCQQLLCHIIVPPVARLMQCSPALKLKKIYIYCVSNVCHNLFIYIVDFCLIKLYKMCLTGKIFYIHISSLTDELLDAAYLSTDCCSVQPSLSSLISLIHFVFGFRCRVWCSLLTHTGL